MIDLTKDEQGHVRVALRFLRSRAGGWKTLAAALECEPCYLADVAGGRAGVSPRMAFRAARLAGVSIDGLLRGEYPLPGTCPLCGHRDATNTAPTGG